jgi:hypothetical protein
MSRKLSLPLLNLGRGSLFEALSPDRPTVDAVRKRLGGRASTEAGAGELVALTTAGGGVLRGVVLFARGDDVDIWVEQADAPAGSTPQPSRPGVVRRARRADIAPLPAPAPHGLDAVADDARVFAALSEGQRIRFHDGGGLGEGSLIEKCRFGGLIRRDDGTVLGVGFRRIWPAQACERRDSERN